MSTKKKLITISSRLVIILVIAVIIKLVFFTTSSANLDKLITAAATDINNRCPIMLDSSTRLDHVVFLPGNVFQYNYTLVGTIKDSIRSEDMKKYLEPVLIKDIRRNSAFKAQRHNKTTMSYSYNDKNGQFILKIDITPAMYNK